MIVDLCAGPGGWDWAAKHLGLPVVGIEIDAAACRTRHAAGLRTVRADIAKVYKVRPDWAFNRPATTVCADPRIPEPGYRGRPEDYGEDGSYNGKRSMEASIKVTVAEASILQSFPPDYPWQGSRTAQFRQVGDAIPVKLAEAILRQVTS